MSTQVKVIGTVVAKAGKAEALRDLLEGMIAPSRAEPGNLRYDLWTEEADSTRFVFDELYIDSAANAAHRASPHFQNYLSKINDLAERSAVVLTPLAVA